MSKKMKEINKLKRYRDMYNDSDINENIAEDEFKELSERIGGKKYLNLKDLGDSRLETTKRQWIWSEYGANQEQCCKVLLSYL